MDFMVILNRGKYLRLQMVSNWANLMLAIYTRNIFKTTKINIVNGNIKAIF